jgi:hypothetical protein
MGVPLALWASRSLRWHFAATLEGAGLVAPSPRWGGMGLGQIDNPRAGRAWLGIV